MPAEPESTGQSQSDSRFKPGQSGNPTGRPKGSRNRLSERFIADFCEVWEEHGIAALRTLVTSDPASLVRAAVSLIPKQFEHSGPEAGPLVVEGKLPTDLELARMIARILLKPDVAALASSEDGPTEASDAEENARQGLG